MSAAAETVFLFDVDNTLLNNDRIEADISAHLEQQFGTTGRERFWAIFESLRGEFGFANYLDTVQRFRLEALQDPRVLGLSSFFLGYPFSRRLYPRAVETLAHLRQFGPTVILSDGDAVFQPHKIRRAGIWDAVEASDATADALAAAMSRALAELAGRVAAALATHVDSEKSA